MYIFKKYFKFYIDFIIIFNYNKIDEYIQLGE